MGCSVAPVVPGKRSQHGKPGGLGRLGRGRGSAGVRPPAGAQGSSLSSEYLERALRPARRTGLQRGGAAVGTAELRQRSAEGLA